MRRLNPKECAVIIIDVQEKLAAAMPEQARNDLLRAASVLMEAAHLLGARVLVTEQYPQGLGPTVAALSEPIAKCGAPIIQKLDFSACDEPAFERELIKNSPKTFIVLGMETHVCVFQTVRELCARGSAVHVPIDGVTSRKDDHKKAGLELCRAAGATLTTMETLVFDWLKRAGSDEFKRLSKLIR